MIEEFQRILRTPKYSPSQMLTKAQDTIICTIEKIFPPSFELNFLHSIFQHVLGNKAFNPNKQDQITVDQRIQLVCQLITHLTQLIKQNFVHQQTYRALQSQTQKAEALIRSHIKTQQHIKIYLDYLQQKIQNLQKKLAIATSTPQILNKEIRILQAKEMALEKEKIVLLEKNESLSVLIAQLEREISGFKTPQSKCLSIRKNKFQDMTTNLKEFEVDSLQSEESVDLKSSQRNRSTFLDQYRSNLYREKYHQDRNL